MALPAASAIRFFVAGMDRIRAMPVVAAVILAGELAVIPAFVLAGRRAWLYALAAENA